jgi:hypothetical protein
VTKIAIVEAMTGQTVDHGLFDDPEEQDEPKTLSDATLMSLGFVMGG